MHRETQGYQPRLLMYLHVSCQTAGTRRLNLDSRFGFGKMTVMGLDSNKDINPADSDSTRRRGLVLLA